MCYFLYISTDSDHDLSVRNNELMSFKKTTAEDKELPTEILNYSNIWYVGSSQGCSCGFRHLMEPDLGFSEPVDWYEEDENDLEATKQIYDVLKELLCNGKNIEIVDKWTQIESIDIKTMNVSFKDVSRNEFRFIENYKFNLVM